MIHFLCFCCFGLVAGVVLVGFLLFCPSVWVCLLFVVVCCGCGIMMLSTVGFVDLFNKFAVLKKRYCINLL